MVDREVAEVVLIQGAVLQVVQETRPQCRLAKEIMVEQAILLLRLKQTIVQVEGEAVPVRWEVMDLIVRPEMVVQDLFLS